MGTLRAYRAEMDRRHKTYIAFDCSGWVWIRYF